jgi:hypothetical protein
MLTKQQMHGVLANLLSLCLLKGITTIGEFIEYNNSHSLEKIERI